MPRLLAALAFALLAGRATAADSPPFGPAVAPLLADYCAGCHSGPNPKGGLDLEHLRPALDDPTAFAAWVRVRDALASGRMPPKGREWPGQEAVAKAAAAPAGNQGVMVLARRKPTVSKRKEGA